MALIMIEGFDLGWDGIAEKSSRFPSITSSVYVTTPGRLGGGKMSGSQAYSFVFPASVASGVIGYANRRTGSDDSGKIVSLRAGATEVVFLRPKSGDVNTLEVVIGSTVVGTVARPTALLNIWAYLEVKWSVGSGSGTFELAWNGVSILSLTALNLGTAAITSLVWGSGTEIQEIDDVYLLDTTGPAPYNTFLGDVHVETLVPNGDGAFSQWVGSDGNSLTNYALVDENPPNSTDYVSASAVGQQDLYALVDPSATGGDDILAVQAQAYFAKSDAGAPVGALHGVLRASTGEVLTSEIASGAEIASTFATRDSAVITTDPTGASWSGTAVTNLQAGVEVV